MSDFEGESRRTSDGSTKLAFDPKATSAPSYGNCSVAFERRGRWHEAALYGLITLAEINQLPATPMGVSTRS
jgi:hypothetical protein